MPAESTKRAARRPANDVHIELKRARGEISCAECRRLKVKCDKKVPCGSCVRRGCTTICPNGILSAGQGTRPILADTEQLHRKIAEMSERIRQLEDALTIFQASVSSDPHPLLRDDLLEIKFGLEARHTTDDSEHARDAMYSTISALGTLTIGEHGLNQTNYIGPSGGVETLILAKSSFSRYAPEDGSPHSEETDPSFAESDQETENTTSALPFSNQAADYDGFMDKLESSLPPHPRAWALCEAYVEYFTWWFRPIKRDELINDVLAPIYKNLSPPNGDCSVPDHQKKRCPHLLSTLFMVLAIGALVDLTLPPCSAEAERYYELARDALSQRSILDSPAMATVQAIALMGAYHSICSARYSLESAWTLLSLSCKIAQAIGLHRDSSAWKLEEQIVQRRRNLFWEVFILDMKHSIAIGRPPSLTSNHVDCELPNNCEGRKNDDQDVSNDFWRWKLEFCKDAFAVVVNALVSAKPPSYNTILDLDRRIRQAILPPSQLYLRPSDADYNNPAICMKGWLMSHHRSITMLHIHRTPFAQALLDHADDPLGSPYAPSFIAANQCASLLIKAFLHLYERSPGLCSRFWGIWSQTFSCAIILVLTVHRSPGVSIASGALIQLGLLLAVFKKGATNSKRTRQAYEILFNLKVKAEKSYHQHQHQRTGTAPDPVPASDIDEQHLAIFGGHTRLMTTAKRPAKPERQSTSEQTSSLPTPDAQPATPPISERDAVIQNVVDGFAEVPPALAEYWSAFPEAVEFEMQQDIPDPIHYAPMTGPQAQTFLPINKDMSAPSTVSSFPAPFEFVMFPEPPAQDSDHFMPTQNQESTFSDAPIDLQQLGLADDVMMNEHWMTLMRETGILDSSGQFVDLQAQQSVYDSGLDGFGYVSQSSMY